MFTPFTFYRSDIWRDFKRNLMIERTNADGLIICEHCGKPIVKAYDCIGHHKVELTDENVNDYSISLNPDLVELIHFKCHNEKHRRFGGFNQRVFLVYGSPCSGKSTWVREHAEPDDLIIDLDSIWECISNTDRYHKPNRLKANVFGVRDCLIDQVKIRKGMWRDCYIIGGYPLRTDRDRICDLLRSEPIFIDEPMETCMSRADNDAWKEYIKDWFEDYVP